MGDFVGTALAFPVVLLSFLLVVVVGYWLLVLLGGAAADSLDPDPGDSLEGAAGFAGFLVVVGLGGVPLSVALSLLIALTWFAGLVGTVVLDGMKLTTPLRIAFGIAVLFVALLLGLFGTRLLVVPLRAVFPDQPAPSRADFVGNICVIRTGHVGPDFGQAEVGAADGSSAVVQVRQAGDDDLHAGSKAVIYEYDPHGEFFWVSPLELETGRD